MRLRQPVGDVVTRAGRARPCNRTVGSDGLLESQCVVKRHALVHRRITVINLIDQVLLCLLQRIAVRSVVVAVSDKIELFFASDLVNTIHVTVMAVYFGKHSVNLDVCFIVPLPCDRSVLCIAYFLSSLCR